MAYPYFQNYPNYNQMLYQQQLQNMQQPQQNTPQIQNGGFVIVKDINEAMNYAVAPGNSVTFKIESQPFICTKTLGFSQLDQPIFEVYRLVKEDNNIKSDPEVVEMPAVEYFSLKEGQRIADEMAKMREEIDFLKEYIETDGKEAKD